MICVVSIEINPGPPEEIASYLAHEYWSQGYFVRDRHHLAWRSCTCLREIRFCESQDGREWVRVDTFNPVNQVQHVVAFLRQEFERVRLLN